MWRKKFRPFFQLVGYLTVGLLAVYGLLMVFNGGSPAWAAVGQAMPNLQASPRVPNVLTYQGMLRRPDGTPLDGEYEMTFRLYNSPVGGELKHTDVISPVVVREGLFTVLLGDAEGNPLSSTAFAGPLYIGVQVGSEQEMDPRQRIAPVAYAVQLTDGVYVDDSGQVGIGKTNPQHQLDVQGDATVNGQFDVWGNANVIGPLWASDLGSTGDITGTNITATGKLDIPRSYQVFHVHTEQGSYNIEWLGYWDLCALMSNEVSGVDDSRDNWAQCSITINPPPPGNTWDNWTDVPWFVQEPGSQADWSLSADAHQNVDYVNCEAICLNLGNFKNPQNP